MYWDWTYIFVIIGALLSLMASAKVKSTFAKYNKTANSRGYTSQEVAAAIMEASGVTGVKIERVKGDLTDHYDPTDKVLRLSDTVYGSTSVAAIGVAAHECGHAIQDREEYGPLKMRAASVPLANFGSGFSFIIVVLGVALGLIGLAKVGVILFSGVVFFQLITLPVEFDASKRALAVLEERGFLQKDELRGARKVLSAAAMTYVAAFASTLLQLLRLILIVRGGRRKD